MGRGFLDEWDDQECDIDRAPIRAFFDEPERERRAPEKFAVAGRLRRMLVGDEIFVPNGDWTPDDPKRFSVFAGKSFVWIKDAKGYYVSREA